MKNLVWAGLSSHSWKYWVCFMLSPITFFTTYHYADGGVLYSLFVASLVSTVAGVPAFIIGFREYQEAADKFFKKIETKE